MLLHTHVLVCSSYVYYLIKGSSSFLHLYCRLLWTRTRWVGSSLLCDQKYMSWKWSSWNLNLGVWWSAKMAQWWWMIWPMRSQCWGQKMISKDMMVGNGAHHIKTVHGNGAHHIKTVHGNAAHHIKTVHGNAAHHIKTVHGNAAHHIKTV